MTAAEDETGERSEPRVVPYWWVTGLVYSALATVTFAPFLMAFLPEDLEDGLFGLAAAGGILLLLLLLVFVGAPIRYRILRFRIDDRELWVRSGLFIHREKIVPTSRLQHVDVVRGPIERLFGLASLVVFTAGGAAATYRLPGLTPERAEALRALALRSAEAQAPDGT